jgi:hypothetical protein
MVPVAFPNPVAVFSKNLLFTTLSKITDVPVNPYQYGELVESWYRHPINRRQVLLFSIDGLEDFSYTAFHLDHGPLNINMIYKFCQKLHGILSVSGWSSRNVRDMVAHYGVILAM